MSEYEFKREYRSVMDSGVPQRSIGAPTSIKTANQLSEVNKRLNAGVYGVDVSIVDPKVFEAIPKQHLKEISRMADMNDAKVTLHAPIVDLIGMDQQGRITEESRKDNEMQMKSFMERAHMLDEKGNIPVNFHVNVGTPGVHKIKMSDDDVKEWKSKLKDFDKKSREKIEGWIKNKEFIRSMGIFDQAEKKVSAVETKVKHSLQGDVLWDPEKSIDNQNRVSWDNDKLQVMNWEKQKREIEEEKKTIELPLVELEHKEKLDRLEGNEKNQLNYLRNEKNKFDRHISEFDTHIGSTAIEMHDKFKKFKSEKDYKEGDKEALKVLGVLKNKFIEVGDQLEKARKKGDVSKFNELVEEQNKLTDDSSSAIMNLSAPRIVIPADEIAEEKTAESVSNVVFDSYEKFENEAPTFCLENYMPGLTLGSAEKLKDVIQESRKRFADKLVEKRGLTKTEAKAAAEKFIGATWDVGHANFLRKHGYGKKEIVKEAEKIAPYVKQMHITDNFGFDDSHLPPGMGNVPTKEQIEAIRKGGKFDFDKGNLIVEAGPFAASFETNPHLYALEGLGSPVYPGGSLWSDVRDLQGAYRTGFGEILPDVHFKSLYGGGFSNLPPELGGQMGGGAGEKGRFAQGQ